MKYLLYALGIITALVLGFVVIDKAYLPPLTILVVGCVGVLAIMAFMAREIIHMSQFDVYDAVDMFLEYTSSQTDSELQKHTEWISAHPEFVIKYHNQFVALALPEYQVVHFCKDVDEFAQYVDNIPTDKRSSVFIYHEALFTPKYWIS